MTNIASIQHGIVFLMAEWSGPAKWAYRQLTDFLGQRDKKTEALICVDVDQQPDIYDVPELSGKIHGWGEVAVVQNGRVVFFTALGKDKKEVKKRCEELLAAYEA